MLVAENLGHIKAIGVMTGRNLDPYIGRAFIGDGIATMVSGASGGTGVTTYAETIGVMAATRIYSTAMFVVAAAIVLVVVGIWAPAGISGSADGDDLLKDEKHRLEQANKTYEGGNKGGSALNMEVVGHTDIGGRGYNADVWVHDGFAYVGSWGFSDWNDGGAQRFCPNDGVAVIDTSDPENPTVEPYAFKSVRTSLTRPLSGLPVDGIWGVRLHECEVAGQPRTCVYASDMTYGLIILALEP